MFMFTCALGYHGVDNKTADRARAKALQTSRRRLVLPKFHYKYFKIVTNTNYKSEIAVQA